MQDIDNFIKPIPSGIKILYDALLVKRGVRLKDKNQSEQQQKQAFQAVSIFYGINKTNQDKINVLNNKKVIISIKKPAYKKRVESALAPYIPLNLINLNPRHIFSLPFLTLSG